MNWLFLVCTIALLAVGGDAWSQAAAANEIAATANAASGKETKKEADKRPKPKPTKKPRKPAPRNP